MPVVVSHFVGIAASKPNLQDTYCGLAKASKLKLTKDAVLSSERLSALDGFGRSKIC